ncbi:MAG: nucleoside transporter C-terminal domain-containing protein [Myxococcota bacterium]|nr:nucleoside transporter C-terminal domain-containing protein [Myxococcota bacterium]
MLTVAAFLSAETTLLDRGISLLGIPILIGLAWLLSHNRKAVNWKPVAWGVALQLIFGVIVLSPMLQDVFRTVVDQGVNTLIGFADEGAKFVFASFVPHSIIGPAGDPVPMDGLSFPLVNMAFSVLPTIVFFSALMSVLYHLGVMQKLVYMVAWVMQRTMGTSGAESLSAAANIFVGQTEAPLVIGPFVKTMTRSELHAVMTGGFATVAGGVMAVYVGFLSDIPGIAGHLVAASIMSAPAALAISKVLYPEDGTPATSGLLKMEVPKSARNALEAAAQGAAEGTRLAINVAGMLIAFVGLVAMVDYGLGLVPIPGDAPLSMAMILGYLFAPIAFVMGVPWAECGVVGTLLGQKIVLTELYAYINLGQMVNADVAVISERSAIIASYALCGFANFASIGIQLGGIGGLAPKRMGDLADLALRAMIGGSLAAFMTGTIAGVLLG